jgi:hypothetical protein
MILLNFSHPLTPAQLPVFPLCSWPNCTGAWAILRPVENTLPPIYKVAEVINLQASRDTARKERY